MINMKQYIMEYRTNKNEPKLIAVEAEGKKDAVAKARKQLKKGCYLVASPKRMYTGPGILHGHDRF